MPLIILRDTKLFERTMKFNLNTFKTSLFFICLTITTLTKVEAMPKPIIQQDAAEINFTYTILKSNGEPQRNVYAKIFGKFDRFNADDNGIINFKYTPNDYNRRVNFYLKDNGNEIVKQVKLDAEHANLTFYLDTQEDILNYKRTGICFPIEGIVVGPENEPLERATVSLQGTGKVAFTDEIGLFNLEADFNHPIVIRADGMNNKTLPITFFLQGDEHDYTIRMHRKDSYELYSSVEKMPQFRGGMEAYQQYLQKNLEYPEKAKKAKIEGVVVVQFIVETNGAITNPQIARHLESTLDSAAWRVIKDMPRWHPASDFGKAVRCKYFLPVAFKIPIPKPGLSKNSLNLQNDSLKLDSLSLDSVVIDSLLTDSLHKDSIMKHTLLTDSLTDDSTQKSLMPADSIQTDSILNLKEAEQTTVKAKKRNIFVRFFRWLFGIERRQRRKAEKAELLKKETILEIHSDSIRIEADSVDIDLRQLKKEIETKGTLKK